YIHTNLYIHYFLKSHNIEHMFFDAFYETSEFGINHDLEIRNIIDDKEYLKVTNELSVFTLSASIKNSSPLLSLATGIQLAANPLKLAIKTNKTKIFIFRYFINNFPLTSLYAFLIVTDRYAQY
ncbi:MAG: hypothetical protein CMK54_02505, partial [Proteobacteria bacterium]|nr:hypothetical protein [Pseudomonadota bacterium]